MTPSQCRHVWPLEYQCVARLLLSWAVVFFRLFVAMFNHGGMPCTCILNTQKLTQNYQGYWLLCNMVMLCGILINVVQFLFNSWQENSFITCHINLHSCLLSDVYTCIHLHKKLHNESGSYIYHVKTICLWNVTGCS